MRSATYATGLAGSFVPIVLSLCIGLASAQPPVESELVELVPEVGPPAAPRPMLPEEDAILLQAGALIPAVLTPALNTARTQDALRLAGLGVGDIGYYLVQVTPGVLPGEAEVLINGAGGEIVGYIPHRTYMVRGPGQTVLALGGDPACQLVTAYHPVDRIHPDLAWRTEETVSLDGAPRPFSLNVVAFPGEDDARISAALRDLNIAVQRFAPDHGQGAVYQVYCPAPTIPWIATIPGVQWIEEWRPTVKHNDFATGSGSSGTDILNISDLWTTYSLNGSGMTVGHADTGLDIGVNNTTLHRDFLNEAGTASRVSNVRAWAMKSNQTYWVDTYASSGTSLTTGPAFLRYSFVAGRNGEVEAVALYMSRDSTAPAGDIRCRLYQTTTPLPSGMPGTPLATSGTVIDAADLPTSGFTACTFYFNPAVAITNGQTYWVVVDLSGIATSNYTLINVMLRGYTGASLDYGSTPTSGSWSTLSNYQLMCRVADDMDWSDRDGHGTHTAGSLAGNGLRYTVGGVPRYRAPAYQANIVHQSVGDDLGGLGGIPPDVGDLLLDAYNQGARIHSDSWGHAADGDYDTQARQVDQFMWDHPDFLLVKSAGNEGFDGRTISPPATLNTSQSLSNSYQYQCFKISPTSIQGYLTSITLSLRRDASGTGTINVHVGPDGGTGANPSGSFSGSFGSINVATGLTTTYQNITFNSNTATLYPQGTYWVYLSWTSRAGSVEVQCNNSGTTSDYVYYSTTSGWSAGVANRVAASLSNGDGLIDTGSMGSPGTSKNCLTIGASETDRTPNTAGYTANWDSFSYTTPIAGSSRLDNTGGMAAFSSRGPCTDTRYKPDLVAPGTYIASCRSQKIPALVSYDVEAVNGTWTAGTGWTRTNAYDRWSGSYAYRAGGAAGSGSLTYNSNLDLTTQGTAEGDWVLWFWSNLTLDGTGDTLTFELSDDGGTTWTDGSTWTDNVEGGTGHFTVDGYGSTWARGAHGAGNYHSATNSWRGQDVITVSDQFLVLNRVTVPNATRPALTFWHIGDWESGYDGGVLEISTDGGRVWSDMGSRIISGDYNRTLSTSSNPLSGRSAWSNDITSWTQVIVDLASYAGTDVSLRWRLGTDSSGSAGYWYLDDFATAIIPWSDDVESGTGSFTHSGTGDTWARGSYGAGNYTSASYSWRATDVATVSDQVLTVSGIALPATSPTLTFWHKGDWESSWDGGVLEINAGGGWTDLGSAITSGGYNLTLNTPSGNPLAGRQAWSTDITTWTQVSVNLATYAGSTVSLRWRLGTDSSGSAGYWYLDDFAITGGTTPSYWVATTSSGWTRQAVEIPDRFNNQNDIRFRFRWTDNAVAPRGICLLDDFTLWRPNGAWGRLNCLEASGWDAQNGYYMFAGGTSMACPLAASVATLVREYYVEKKSLSDPSAALIKATMINEATDLYPGQYGGPPYEIQARPDNAQGWGRINAKKSLYRTSPRFGGYCDIDSVSSWVFTGTGQTREIRLAVPNTPANLAEPIKVTLVWSDRPGTAGASPSLVNDLDLRVDRMSNVGYPTWNPTVAQTWYGNNNASGDRRNNVEEVDIPVSVTYGWYRVTVSCYALPSGGNQPWALVASGGFTANPQPTPVELEEFTAKRLGPGEVQLAWKPAAGIDVVGCRVLRAESVEGPFEEISTGLVNCDRPGCTFVDRSASAGHGYYYRLELVGAIGQSMPTDVVRVARIH